MGALVWAHGCFPHIVLRGAGEGCEGKVVLDGRREAKEDWVEGLFNLMPLILDFASCSE